MRLLSNLRWPLLAALSGLMLIPEAQGKPESDEVKAVLQKAEAGDMQSQAWLGMMHYEGAGVSKNLDEAAKWLKRAAESGSVEAQYMLSKMYDKGEGLPKSEAEKSKWLIKAAESGHAKAQYEYGFEISFYFGPRNPSRDAESVKWFRKSADQGYAPALVALANCFYFGDGVVESNDEAERYYRKAAEQDYKEAKVALGKMMLRNEAKYKSLAEYLTLARMAREASPKVLEIDDEGDIWLTDFDGLRTKCESDETGTVLVPGSVELKDTYLEVEGHKQNDKRKNCVKLFAEPWRSFGDETKLKINPQFFYYQWYFVNLEVHTLSPIQAPHGYMRDNPWSKGNGSKDLGNQNFSLNLDAQLAIAEQLRFAAIKTPSRTTPYIAVPEIEVRWYKRASEYGHAEAQYQLAHCYSKGLGVEKNLSMAAKWFMKSAEQGNADAQCQVGYCYLLGLGLPRDEIEGYAYLNMASAANDSLRESLRRELIELEIKMPDSARYAGQQRTRQLIKEVESKREAALRQSAESKKAREKRGA